MDFIECTQKMDLPFEEDREDRAFDKTQPTLVGMLVVEGVSHDVYSGENVIGRDASKCSIVINSKAVSSEHALIDAAIGDGAVVYDLGSSNKTRLGTLSLRPHVRYHLPDGAQLFFADVPASYMVHVRCLETPLKASRSRLAPEPTVIDESSDDSLIEASPDAAASGCQWRPSDSWTGQVKATVEDEMEVIFQPGHDSSLRHAHSESTDRDSDAGRAASSPAATGSADVDSALTSKERAESDSDDSERVSPSLVRDLGESDRQHSENNLVGSPVMDEDVHNQPTQSNVGVARNIEADYDTDPDDICNQPTQKAVKKIRSSVVDESKLLAGESTNVGSQSGDDTDPDDICNQPTQKAVKKICSSVVDESKPLAGKSTDVESQSGDDTDPDDICNQPTQKAVKKIRSSVVDESKPLAGKSTDVESQSGDDTDPDDICNQPTQKAVKKIRSSVVDKSKLLAGKSTNVGSQSGNDMDPDDICNQPTQKAVKKIRSSVVDESKLLAGKSTNVESQSGDDTDPDDICNQPTQKAVKKIRSSVVDESKSTNVESQSGDDTDPDDICNQPTQKAVKKIRSSIVDKSKPLAGESTNVELKLADNTDPDDICNQPTQKVVKKIRFSVVDESEPLAGKSTNVESQSGDDTDPDDIYNQPTQKAVKKIRSSIVVESKPLAGKLTDVELKLADDTDPDDIYNQPTQKAVKKIRSSVVDESKPLAGKLTDLELKLADDTDPDDIYNQPTQKAVKKIRSSVVDESKPLAGKSMNVESQSGDDTDPDDICNQPTQKAVKKIRSSIVVESKPLAGKLTDVELKLADDTDPDDIYNQPTQKAVKKIRFSVVDESKPLAGKSTNVESQSGDDTDSDDIYNQPTQKAVKKIRSSVVDESKPLAGKLTDVELKLADDTDPDDIYNQPTQKAVKKIRFSVVDESKPLAGKSTNVESQSGDDTDPDDIYNQPTQKAVKKISSSVVDESKPLAGKSTDVELKSADDTDPDNFFTMMTRKVLGKSITKSDSGDETDREDFFDEKTHVGKSNGVKCSVSLPNGEGNVPNGETAANGVSVLEEKSKCVSGISDSGKSPDAKDEADSFDIHNAETQVYQKTAKTRVVTEEKIGPQVDIGSNDFGEDVFDIHSASTQKNSKLPSLTEYNTHSAEIRAVSEVKSDETGHAAQMQVTFTDHKSTDDDTNDAETRFNPNKSNASKLKNIHSAAAICSEDSTDRDVDIHDAATQVNPRTSVPEDIHEAETQIVKPRSMKELKVCILHEDSSDTDIDNVDTQSNLKIRKKLSMKRDFHELDTQIVEPKTMKRGKAIQEDCSDGDIHNAETKINPKMRMKKTLKKKGVHEVETQIVGRKNVKDKVSIISDSEESENPSVPADIHNAETQIVDLSKLSVTSKRTDSSDQGVPNISSADILNADLILDTSVFEADTQLIQTASFMSHLEPIGSSEEMTAEDIFNAPTQNSLGNLTVDESDIFDRDTQLTEKPPLAIKVDRMDSFPATPGTSKAADIPISTNVSLSVSASDSSSLNLQLSYSLDESVPKETVEQPDAVVTRSSSFESCSSTQPSEALLSEYNKPSAQLLRVKQEPGASRQPIAFVELSDSEDDLMLPSSQTFLQDLASIPCDSQTQVAAHGSEEEDSPVRTTRRRRGRDVYSPSPISRARRTAAPSASSQETRHAGARRTNKRVTEIEKIFTGKSVADSDEDVAGTSSGVTTGRGTRNRGMKGVKGTGVKTKVGGKKGGPESMVQPIQEQGEKLVEIVETELRVKTTRGRPNKGVPKAIEPAKEQEAVVIEDMIGSKRGRLMATGLPEETDKTKNLAEATSSVLGVVTEDSCSGARRETQVSHFMAESEENALLSGIMKSTSKTGAKVKDYKETVDVPKEEVESEADPSTSVNQRPSRQRKATWKVRGHPFHVATEPLVLRLSRSSSREKTANKSVSKEGKEVQRAISEPATRRNPVKENEGDGNFKKGSRRRANLVEPTEAPVRVSRLKGSDSQDSVQLPSTSSETAVVVGRAARNKADKSQDVSVAAETTRVEGMNMLGKKDDGTLSLPVESTAVSVSRHTGRSQEEVENVRPFSVETTVGRAMRSKVSVDMQDTSEDREIPNPKRVEKSVTLAKSNSVRASRTRPGESQEVEIEEICVEREVAVPKKVAKPVTCVKTTAVRASQTKAAESQEAVIEEQSAEHKKTTNIGGKTKPVDKKSSPTKKRKFGELEETPEKEENVFVKRGRGKASVIERRKEEEMEEELSGKVGRGKASVVERRKEEDTSSKRGRGETSVVEETKEEEPSKKGRRGKASVVERRKEEDTSSKRGRGETSVVEETKEEEPSKKGRRGKASVIEGKKEEEPSRKGRRGKASVIEERKEEEPSRTRERGEASVVEERKEEEPSRKGRRGKASVIEKRKEDKMEEESSQKGRRGKASVIEERKEEDTSSKRGRGEASVVEERKGEEPSRKGRRGKTSVIEERKEKEMEEEPSRKGGRGKASVIEGRKEEEPSRKGRRGKASVIEGRKEKEMEEELSRKGERDKTAEAASSPASSMARVSAGRKREAEEAVSVTPAKRMKPRDGASSGRKGRGSLSSLSSIDVSGTPRRSGRDSLGKKNEPQHRVLFTGFSNDNQNAILARLGGAVVDSAANCTVLVTDKVRRTCKFLSCVARAIPVVSPAWLLESGKKSRFLDPWDFLLADAESEKKFDFRLAASLAGSSAQRLLHGYSILVTAGVKPPPAEMKGIVESCGGQLLSRAPVCWPDRSLVVSCQEDRATWPRLRDPPHIVTAEFILIGALQQRLNFQANLLQ